MMNFSSEAERPPIAKARDRPETSPGLQRQAVGEARGGIQDRQVPERQQEDGALEEPQPYGGAD